MAKTILITGATAGFGEAAARKFVAGGWRAIGTGRRGDRLKALQDELEDEFLPLEVDMRDIAAVESLAKLAARGMRSTCSSTTRASRPPTDPMPETDWERIANGDRHQHHRPRRAHPRASAETGRAQGAIVNLSSVAATYPYKGGAVYAGPRRSSASSRWTCAATSQEPGSG